MIIVDFSQTGIASVMQQLNSNPKMKLEEGLIRHIVLNTLRSYIQQFKTKYGTIVIACDSKKYWRRDVFPFYKAHRKKDREKSDFDWVAIFEALSKIRDELKEHFPYKVVEVEGAEADDIIAVLVKKYSQQENILILSSDNDFVQLQKYPNVSQYSPIMKRFVTTEDPKAFTKEHIIRGDRGDGVPNFLSSDNVFVVGERQKPINSKKLAEWITKDPVEFCTTDTMLRNYKRNQVLVDLDFIPPEISTKILEQYDDAKTGSKMKMLNYLIENRLGELASVVDEF